MYPHDNIFNIYYNIGKRTPFLVKRCELGLARSSSEERRIDPNRDRTFLVETVKPRGKYGKAYYSSFIGMAPMDAPQVSILVIGSALWMVSQMIVIDRSAIQISKMRKFLVLDVENGFWLMFPVYRLMKYFLSTKRKKYYSLENIKENPWGIFIQRITTISSG